MFQQNVSPKVKIKMVVDARELQFLRQNGPHNLAALVSKNVGVNRSSVNNELSRIKSDYNEVIINEARRLVKVINGVEYNPMEA